MLVYQIAWVDKVMGGKYTLIRVNSNSPKRVLIVINSRDLSSGGIRKNAFLLSSLEKSFDSGN